MNLHLIGLSIVIVIGVSGWFLLPGWRRGELHPAEQTVVVHGGLALLACAMLLLLFDASTRLGTPELVALALVVGSGAMMFGARQRARHCPKALLWVHLGSFLALCAVLLL